ncbi:MAG: Signal transduction histidine-protein kinase BaeS [Anaerolineales bacterium]|nr:Signal transduction histidine-protein kinase BaeS [Anaerolineales bacterium]
MGPETVRSSLRRRLMLSYLLVVVLTVGGVALLAGQLTARQFRALVAQSGQARAQALALYFADFYETQGSWEGVEQAMTHLREAQWQPAGLPLEAASVLPWRVPPPPWLSKETIERWVNLGEPRADRVRLADPDGTILADSHDSHDSPAGPRLPADELARGAPVIIDGERKGTVVVDAGLGRLTPQQRAFVRVIWRRLIGVSILAGFVALALSFGLAREITNPVQALTDAARRLAAGDWDQKLPVQSEDELGQMTHAFNEMAAELTRQTQLRRQMVADIAHELRTPLSVLYLELEALEDGFQSPDEAITSLHGELGLLTQLVEDLRLLAQTDAGELPIHIENTDLGALTSEIVERWESRTAARGVRLAVQTAGDLPPVNTDRTRITQVLTNLLANALRHTPEGGEISIAVDRYRGELEKDTLVAELPAPSSSRPGSAHGECFVEVSVRDTGEGIASTELPNVFERFYRVDRARSRDTGGAGLGLAIARRLVELHGGYIWAESEEGAGSTFTFVLPAEELM